LALWGTLVWALVSMAILLLVKYVYSPQSVLPGKWLFVGLTLLCVLYFVATLLGLWVGSRRGRPTSPSSFPT
jgi:hypothetical protein